MNHNALSIALAAALLVYFLVHRLGKVSPARARQLVAEGAVLVDVRSPGEFAGGHLPGALNVPVSDVRRQAAALVEQGKPIVVYCASGMRSASAAATLKAAGAQVFDLGAMSRWG
jgi:phage shock protein E